MVRKSVPPILYGNYTDMRRIVKYIFVTTLLLNLYVTRGRQTTGPECNHSKSALMSMHRPAATPITAAGRKINPGHGEMIRTGILTAGRMGLSINDYGAGERAIPPNFEN
jgi:hypothetical protein